MNSKEKIDLYCKYISNIHNEFFLECCEWNNENIEKSK